jgi:hypothetical protein
MTPAGTRRDPAGPDDRPPVRIPITGELDLHTFRPREIASLLDGYLAECARANLRVVRIVHGKGTGTLRDLVHARLRRSPRVKGFRLGDERTGGWGATLVTLNSGGATADTAHPAFLPSVNRGIANAPEVKSLPSSTPTP